MVGMVVTLIFPDDGYGGGDDFTIASGSSFSVTWCLKDGDYVGTYTPGSYSGENSWNATVDGATIASFANESGTVTVGGAPQVGGCTDPDAPEYTAGNDYDDGSCWTACAAAGCNILTLSSGSCSSSCNIAACNYDGGDCCESTSSCDDCYGCWYSAGYNCGGCIDPNACENDTSSPDYCGVPPCSDATACNDGAYEACIFPSGCDTACGSTAVNDSCGNCGGDCAEYGGGCTDDAYYNSQYSETCATFNNYPQWCGDANDSGGTGYDACCVCGGGTSTAGTISCGDDADNAVVADCNGSCGGSATADCAGTCEGPATTDCTGACNGTASEDCNGDCNGTAYEDFCNDCVGGLTGEVECVADCNGDIGGTAEFDDCETCSGGNSGHVANSDIDSCGICSGADASLDCNGDCSGSFPAGTFTNENPGGMVDPDAPTLVYGEADDESWILKPCIWLSNSSEVFNGDYSEVTITSVYGADDDFSCELSSDVFNGAVTTTNISTHSTADMSVIGTISFTMSNGTNLNFTSTGTFDGMNEYGDIEGSLAGGSTGGLTDDCNNDCGGSAVVDSCSVCGGLDASLCWDSSCDDGSGCPIDDSMGACVDTQLTEDSTGWTCSQNAGYSWECSTSYDDDDYLAANCCQCGGGASSCNDAGGDGVVPSCDGTCTLPGDEAVCGCDDPTAVNYDASVTYSDGSCIAYGSDDDYPLAITDGDYSGNCGVYYSFIGTVLGTATVTPSGLYYDEDIYIFDSVAGMQNYFDNSDASGMLAQSVNATAVADVVTGQEYGLFVQGTDWIWCEDMGFNLTQAEYPPMPEITSISGGAEEVCIEWNAIPNATTGNNGGGLETARVDNLNVTKPSADKISVLAFNSEESQKKLMKENMSVFEDNLHAQWYADNPNAPRRVEPMVNLDMGQAIAEKRDNAPSGNSGNSRDSFYSQDFYSSPSEWTLGNWTYEEWSYPYYIKKTYGYDYNDHPASFTVDLSGASTATLSWNQWGSYCTWDYGSNTVIVNGDNLGDVGCDASSTSKSLSLDAYAGNASVTISFNYYGYNAHTWQVDDVSMMVILQVLLVMMLLLVTMVPQQRVSML